MSAIWGICAQGYDSALKGVFERMCTVMPFSSQDGTRKSVIEHTLLGHSSLGTLHDDGYPLLTTDGAAISVAGIPVWEGSKGYGNKRFSANEEGTQDSELLQYALDNACLSDVGGMFAFAMWNPRSRRLTLGTDRLGFQGFYYLHDEKRNVLYFASRLRGISQCVPEVDEINYAAVREFLNFGHSLGDKTFYAQINLVPPGYLLEYDSSGIVLKEYCNIGNIRIDHAMTYQDAVEHNAAALKKAIARRVSRCKGAKTTLLLSGGADSRRIAGELRSQGVDFKSFTTRGFSEKDSEAAIAAAVAAALGVENQFVEVPLNEFISRFWSRANNILDYESCLHQWLLPLVDELPNNSGVNYDGLGGDIVLEGVFRASGFAEQQEFNTVNNLNVRSKAKRIIGREVKVSFLKQSLRDNLAGVSLEDSVVQALERYAASENQLTLFYLMNRTRRSISLASARILQEKVDSLYPFLDMDVLNAALAVPYKYRLKHTLRRDIVEFAYPELSSIPYTQYKSQVEGYSTGFRKPFRHVKAIQLRDNIKKFSTHTHSPLSRKVIPKLALRYVLSYLGHIQPPPELELTFQVFYEWFIEHAHQCSPPKRKTV
jgi:asparagine synthetase B (glutamine-hydrolysing)